MSKSHMDRINALSERIDRVLENQLIPLIALLTLIAFICNIGEVS